METVAKGQSFTDLVEPQRTEPLGLRLPSPSPEVGPHLSSHFGEVLAVGPYHSWSAFFKGSAFGERSCKCGGGSCVQSSDRGCALRGTQVGWLPVVETGALKLQRIGKSTYPRDRRIFLYYELTIEPPKATRGRHRTRPETIRFS